MIQVGFKPYYRVLHFTSEIGGYIVGGIASFMNELYRYHPPDVGFVHLYDPRTTPDLALDLYPGREDILAVSYAEAYRIKQLSFDIAVIHFYALSFLLDEAILQDRPLVYVVHSVPTPEPYYPENPFGGHEAIRQDFEAMCRRANVIVCVSNAEREKLRTLYPELGPKIRVIHNGIQPAEDSHPANPAEEPREQPEVPIRAHRRVFGFLGRLDYRKGLLECIKAFKGLDDAELRVACDNQASAYFSGLLDYIEGAGLNDKVTFYGWCQGPRKQSFLQSLDALIVPSLYEPFGYVVLEAMNAQVPLICSNRGGIPEIVGDYRFCFDPYELGALRECIRQFQAASAEEVKKEAMALFARLRLFTAQAMCEKYAQLLSSVSASHSPPAAAG